MNQFKCNNKQNNNNKTNELNNSEKSLDHNYDNAFKKPISYIILSAAFHRLQIRQY